MLRRSCSRLRPQLLRFRTYASASSDNDNATRHEEHVEASRKGGEASAHRPEEARKEAARKAARTRAQRYGTKMNISDPSRDDLMQKGIESGRAAGFSTYAISRYVRAGPLLVRQVLAASQWATPRSPPPAMDPVDEGDEHDEGIHFQVGPGAHAARDVRKRRPGDPKVEGLAGRCVNCIACIWAGCVLTLMVADLQLIACEIRMQSLSPVRCTCPIGSPRNLSLRGSLPWPSQSAGRPNRLAALKPVCVGKVSEADFEEQVLKSNTPVLIDFWATWCGPCKLVEKPLNNLEQKYEGKLKVLKCEADPNPSLVEKYKVYGLPTFVLFKDGKVIDGSQKEGAISEKALESYLEQHRVV
eukprot:jgi/Astpho2/6643/Aster-05005